MDKERDTDTAPPWPLDLPAGAEIDEDDPIELTEEGRNALRRLLTEDR